MTDVKLAISLCVDGSTVKGSDVTPGSSGDVLRMSPVSIFREDLKEVSHSEPPSSYSLEKLHGINYRWIKADICQPYIG